jgi:hypothetical protein
VKWWTLLRDVLGTVTGLGVIVSQVFSARPSDVLLVVGLTLTSPSLVDHTRALLSGPTGSPPSPSSPPSGPSPPSRRDGE